jgi:hypothetical protein
LIYAKSVFPKQPNIGTVFLPTVRLVGRSIGEVLLLLGRSVRVLVVLLALVRPVVLALVIVLLNCSLKEFLYDQNLRELV